MLAGLPDTNFTGSGDNYTTLQEFTADSNKAGGKVDLQASARRCTMFGRYGFRNLDTFDAAEHPAAVGRRGQRRHLREEPAVRVRNDVGADAELAARSALRLLVDAGRQESAGAGHRQRVRCSSACRACPTIARIAGGLPTQLDHRLFGSRPPGDQPAVAVPDGLQPEDQLHVDDEAHSFKSGYEFQNIDTEVQDVNPLYGRDTYNGPFTRSGGRGGEQPL